MKEHVEYKESGLALIPFAMFIVLLVGGGLVLNASGGGERAFYQIPASVAVLAAVVIAFVIYKGSVEEKMDAFIKGCVNENIAIMYMTCFLAGAIAEVAKAVGGRYCCTATDFTVYVVCHVAGGIGSHINLYSVC